MISQDINHLTAGIFLSHPGEKSKAANPWLKFTALILQLVDSRHLNKEQTIDQ
jgi:hypothetical protein